MKLQAYEFYEIYDGKENYRKTFTTLEAAKKYYTRMTMQGALLRARVDGNQLLIHEADELFRSNDEVQRNSRPLRRKASSH